MSDAAKETISTLFTISSASINIITGIKTLTEASIDATKGTAESAAEEISTLEKASVILAIISAAMQIVQKIASWFKSKNTKKQEKIISALQKQIDALQKSYDKLGDQIDEAFGKDASDLIAQQTVLLEQQKILLQRQIKAEKDKKKTDKNKVKQYQDEIDAINELIDSTAERQMEAIIGQDVKSAIEEFADAYMEAWEAGEDKAKAIKDSAKEMIRSAVKEFISARMSGEVRKFYEYLASAMEDGILTVAEQQTLDALEQAIEQKMESLNNTLDQYVVDESTQTREADSKGFENMSQDSADELNGRFAVIQAHTYIISEAIKFLQINSTAQLAYLSSININTYKLFQIERDITSLKNDINEINILGVRIR